MKKKILTMLLALVLVSTQFMGCGTSGKSDEKKEEKSVEKEEVKKETKKEKKFKAERGTVTDGVYTNKAFGVSLPIPEGWTLCSEKELLEAADVPESFLKEDGTFDAEEVLEETDGLLIDAHAMAQEGFADVIIEYMCLEGWEEDAANEEEVFQILLEEIGEDELGEVSKQNINGTDMFISTIDYGGGYFQKMYCHMVGDYMVVLSVFYDTESQQMAEDAVAGVQFEK